MDISTLGTVVGIVAICYVIGLGCKAYEKIPDKWIPVIMAVCGGVLGVAGLSGRRCDQCSCGRNGQRISGDRSKSVI